MDSRGNLAFEAIADPTRRTILGLLSAHDECSASDIAASIDSVGRTAVSSHLRVLRAAGLVSERREGRFRYYSLNPGPAEEVLLFLVGLYRSSLTELKHAAEAANDEVLGV